MGLLGFTPEEYKFYIRSMSEALKLIGNEAYIREVKENRTNFYGDSSYSNKHRIKANIIFDNHPKPILRKMGWNTEEEDHPFVAWLSILSEKEKIIEMEEGLIVEVIGINGPDATQVFRVTRCHGSTIDPTMWLLLMMPYRKEIDFVPETPKHETVDPTKKDTEDKYIKRVI